MSEEEGLTAAYEAWSRSRDAFQLWVEQEKPSAPADKWQKLYYRGIRPDGSAGPADHDSKLRLAPFVQPDGTPMVPDEPVKRFRILTLQSLGQGMADLAVALRYETASRPEGLRWRELIDRNRQTLVAACADLDAHWIAELKEVTMGSISVAAALAYVDFRHGDLNWRDGSGRLADWFGRFSARPSMAPVAA